jgi:hypothetical protein
MIQLKDYLLSHPFTKSTLGAHKLLFYKNPSAASLKLQRLEIRFHYLSEIALRPLKSPSDYHVRVTLPACQLLTDHFIYGLTLLLRGETPRTFTPAESTAAIRTVVFRRAFFTSHLNLRYTA